jgi:hypothetical protein
MKICVLEFGSDIHWKLRVGEPPLYSIRAHPGVQLVTPLLFGELTSLMSAKNLSPKRLQNDCYVGNLRLITTSGLAFNVAEDCASTYELEGEDIVTRILSKASPIIDVAVPLLDALRYFSKQVDLPRGGAAVNFWEWIEPKSLPAVIAPVFSGKEKRAVSKSLIETAITRENIESACACEIGFRAPIFDTLFLDAIGAHHENDFRRAILYSAIALETAVATLLDDEYESRVKISNSAAWRSISLPTGVDNTPERTPSGKF